MTDAISIFKIFNFRLEHLIFVKYFVQMIITIKLLMRSYFMQGFHLSMLILKNFLKVNAFGYCHYFMSQFG